MEDDHRTLEVLEGALLAAGVVGDADRMKGRGGNDFSENWA